MIQNETNPMDFLLFISVHAQSSSPKLKQEPRLDRKHNARLRPLCFTIR